MSLHVRLIMRRITGFCLYLLLFMLGTTIQATATESSFLEEVKNTNEPFDNNSIPRVQQIIEDTVLSKDKSAGAYFRVLSRKKDIERYKCSGCHNDKPVEAKQGLELTHGNVAINHGVDDRRLSCIDCHHPEDRDFLEDKKGRKIDFDHSYQLCGQCHFRQKRDWIGGAHGKRVDNWAGERVVYNCTSCHNPHSPRFEKRFPATYSVPLD